MSNIKNNVPVTPPSLHPFALPADTVELPPLRWLHAVTHAAECMPECSVIAHWRRRGLHTPQMMEGR